MKTYEGLFIFPDTLKDDAVDAAVRRLLSEIEKQEGKVRNTEVLGKRVFSRILQKKEAGQYVRVAFDMAPDKVAPLQARLKLIEELFRVQIVRVEEAPVAAKVAEGAAPAGAAAEPKPGAGGAADGVV